MNAAARCRAVTSTYAPATTTKASYVLAAAAAAPVAGVYGSRHRLRLWDLWVELAITNQAAVVSASRKGSKKTRKNAS